MKISIIIPTLNRPDQLKKLLFRLGEVVEKEELIIVDDSKDELPQEIFNHFKFRIKYIHRGERLGVSSARNIGAAEAKGEYLLFFDDDDDFTTDWLEDFRSSLKSNPGIVYCDMKVVDRFGKEENVSAQMRKRPIVIPGSWLIKKEIFDQIKGFDERLNFAENTELFFRIDQIEKPTEYIKKPNFIYHQSVDGGSKNLQNMIDSILIILEKHDKLLTEHVKYLYHQIVGVNQLRFQRFAQARKHLWKAYRYKPWKVKTLARFGLSFLPILSKRIYTKDVNI
ncbi:MAG: glycosyltransferase [Algoriphagus sp.]|uniref:glycosyltransferase family 2 protein n=1 Tax=Algoriphagus sp. TaxID=1872435 RepID=UPI0017F32411|nr:glycosyltransferase [Algoriphagus sp.]NVJ86813.1 glycosyltransferase [Algoriphagus sp.]